jgi:ATP adenylyltransferase
MNLYPYNNGHVMVVPYRHTSSLKELTRKEHAEIMATTSMMIEALTSVMNPHGFNLGANLGRAAGAGIDQHIHFHVVPRWNGDTNFMPTLGDTKLVSEDLRKSYKKLRAAIGSIPLKKKRLPRRRRDAERGI